jgi:hypothetical protein
MSDERNPSNAYPGQHYGEHPGRFEVDARVWRDGDPLSLVEYITTGATTPAAGRVTVEAFKPDARINLRLTFGFVARDPDVDTLNGVTSNGNTLRVNLALTKLWLSGCDAFGGGLQECGDLVGTEAVPVTMISDGNWGQIYEVDVDCKAVRARIDFATPGVPGRFFAAAKWVAVCPISDRDWMHARERMQVLVRPKSLVLRRQPV